MIKKFSSVSNSIVITMAVIAMVSCSLSGHGNNTMLLNERLLFRHEVTEGYPCFSINNNENSFYQQDIQSSVTYDFSLADLNIKKVDVLKRIYWRGSQLNVSTKYKDNIKPDLVFELKSKTFNWKKELPFGDVEANNNGFLYISDDTIALFDIKTGNFVWKVSTNYFTVVPISSRSHFLFISDNAIIVNTDEGLKVLDTNDGSVSNVIIDVETNTICNFEGFTYKGSYYYVDKNLKLIKYPDSIVYDLNKIVEKNKQYYIGIYSDRLVLMELDSYKGIVMYINAFENFFIYKPNYDSSIINSYKTSNVLVYPLNINKTNENKYPIVYKGHSAYVLGDYLLVYGGESIICYSNNNTIVWEFDLNKYKNLDMLSVIYADKKHVVIKTNSELCCYEVP